MRQVGRHFCQIAGPAPIPDRGLHAVKILAIEHRISGVADLRSQRCKYDERH